MHVLVQVWMTWVAFTKRFADLHANTTDCSTQREKVETNVVIFLHHLICASQRLGMQHSKYGVKNVYVDESH